MNVPGENLKGVYSANEYLTRINLMTAWQFPRSDTRYCKANASPWSAVANVAMDAAVRTAKRLGAESAMIVYRRTAQETACPGRGSPSCRRGKESNFILNRAGRK